MRGTTSWGLTGTVHFERRYLDKDANALSVVIIFENHESDWWLHYLSEVIFEKCSRIGHHISYDRICYRNDLLPNGQAGCWCLLNLCVLFNRRFFWRIHWHLESSSLRSSMPGHHLTANEYWRIEAERGDSPHAGGSSILRELIVMQNSDWIVFTVLLDCYQSDPD